MELMSDRRDWKSFACEIGDHGSCLVGEPVDRLMGGLYCTCSCHGFEPPAGMREPRTPTGPKPTLKEYIGLA